MVTCQDFPRIRLGDWLLDCLEVAHQVDDVPAIIGDGAVPAEPHLLEHSE